jgi:hypothetical protein
MAGQNPELLEGFGKAFDPSGRKEQASNDQSEHYKCRQTRAFA